MSWVTDYYDDATYETLTSNIGVSWIYYIKKFLETIQEKVRMVPLGKPVPLPEGNGNTVQWHRYNQLSRSVSNATLTEGKMPNATLYTMQYLQKAIAEYGAFVQTSSLLDQITIDQGNDGVVDLVSNHASQILDILTHREVASNGGYPLRADYSTDTGATYKGAVTTATSTTSFADSALETNTDYGDANDDLNQSVIIFISGTANGQSRTVSDYATSGGVITTPAFDVAPAVGDQFIVTTPDALASGDKMTYENLKRAVTILSDSGATAGADGYYVCVADPYTLELLMDDTKWIAVKEYSDPKGIFKGEVGRFMRTRFVEENLPARFPITTRGTAGTSYGPGSGGANLTETDTAGVTYVKAVPIMGQGAYGVTTFAKKKATAPPIYFRSWKDLGQPIPRWSTIGWMLEFACKALQPRHLVNLWLYDNK
jgi:hypothetical protein